MDMNKDRVRNSTLAQLWNDEIIDRERIDTGEMSKAEARSALSSGIKLPDYTVIARDRWRR